MTAPRPEIFISATSQDLKSCRQLVRDALLTLGCVPITQDHFAPDARTVREMLREKIAACDAVIHLAGGCYGAEPQGRDPAEPRRSYTQIEYDIARELDKPLYTFVCAEGFPYDAHEQEADELRTLQGQHRAAIQSRDHLFRPIGSPTDLEKSVRELQTRVEHLSKHLDKTRSWLGRGVAAAALILLAIGCLLYALKHRADQGSQQLAAVRQEAESARRETATLRQQLEAQTQTSTQILAAVQRLGSAAAPSSQRDPAAPAQAEVAQERGISVGDLQKQLADEKTDVRQLLAQIQPKTVAAEAQAAQWKILQRDALTKLGDTEYAASRYREAVEPYQQALALYDENKEPLPWCDAAQKLGLALRQQERYAEGESLARKLVDKRAALQGAEHRDTLASLANLSGLLYDKGDYASAEPLVRRILTARERTLGKEHPDTLRSLNALANALTEKHDYAGAEPLFRRLIEAQERTLGQDHPHTLNSIRNLAVLLRKKGDLAGAEPLFRRVLEAQERTLGRDHPDTLRSLNSVAMLLQAKGDLAGSELLFRRAMEARERTSGREHPLTLQVISNLAQLLDSKGDFAEAGLLYQRALEGMEHTQPAEHPNRLDLDYYYSLMRQKQGRLNEALALAEHAVAGARKSLPEADPDRVAYEKHLADLQEKIAAKRAGQ